MVTLELRPETKEPNQALEAQVTRQVAEIMEAADREEEQVGELAPVSETWNFSMPFAGVRYYSYD